MYAAKLTGTLTARELFVAWPAVLPGTTSKVSVQSNIGCLIKYFNTGQ
jgi:hypothetical protein